jgi:hypothetical protein
VEAVADVAGWLALLVDAEANGFDVASLEVADRRLAGALGVSVTAAARDLPSECLAYYTQAEDAITDYLNGIADGPCYDDGD